MADIFLSYARKDAARAAIIRDRLEDLGLDVFFDTEGLDGGDVFPDVLDRELKSASAVVGVWSPHALTRPWVRIECDIGRTRGVLVPAAIETISELDTPAAFWNINYIDLSDFTGDTQHAGWLRLVRSLARTLDRPELLAREDSRPAHASASTDADVRAEMAALRAEMERLRQDTAGRPTPAIEQSVTGAAAGTRISKSVEITHDGGAGSDAPKPAGKRLLAWAVGLFALVGIGLSAVMVIGYLDENADADLPPWQRVSDEEWSTKWLRDIARDVLKQTSEDELIAAAKAGDPDAATVLALAIMDDFDSASLIPISRVSDDPEASAQGLVIKYVKIGCDGDNTLACSLSALIRFSEARAFDTETNFLVLANSKQNFERGCNQGNLYACLFNEMVKIDFLKNTEDRDTEQIEASFLKMREYCEAGNAMACYLGAETANDYLNIDEDEVDALYGRACLLTDDWCGR